MVELQNAIHSILSAPLTAEPLLQTWDDVCSWNIYMWNHSLGRGVKYCPLGCIPLPGRTHLLSFFFLTAAFSSCCVLFFFHSSSTKLLFCREFWLRRGCRWNARDGKPLCLPFGNATHSVLCTVGEGCLQYHLPHQQYIQKNDYLYYRDTLSQSPLAHFNVLPPSLSCDNSWLLSYGRLIHTESWACTVLSQ